MLGLFAVAFVRLGMLGMSEGTPAQTIEMRVWTFVYFAFFILMPIISGRGLIPSPSAVPITTGASSTTEGAPSRP